MQWRIPEYVLHWISLIRGSLNIHHRNYMHLRITIWESGLVMRRVHFIRKGKQILNIRWVDEKMGLKIAKTTTFRHAHQLEETQGPTSGWKDKSLLSKALISIMVYYFTTIIIDFPFGGGHILRSSWSHMCNALIAPICITIYCSNNQLLLRGSRHTLRLSWSQLCKVHCSVLARMAQ